MECRDILETLSYDFTCYNSRSEDAQLKTISRLVHGLDPSALYSSNDPADVASLAIGVTTLKIKGMLHDLYLQWLQNFFIWKKLSLVIEIRNFETNELVSNPKVFHFPLEKRYIAKDFSS